MRDDITVAICKLALAIVAVATLVLVTCVVLLVINFTFRCVVLGYC